MSNPTLALHKSLALARARLERLVAARGLDDPGVKRQNAKVDELEVEIQRRKTG